MKAAEHGWAAAPTDLSVVIPAHNSAALIEGTIARLAGRLSDRSAEIIVVENGSTDDTFARCMRMRESWRDRRVTLVVTQSAKGMGSALRTGVEISRGVSVLLTADDLPFGFDDIDAADALAKSPGGYLPPIIIGSKAHPSSRVGRGAIRGVLASGFGLLRRLILGTRVRDSQGTFLVDGNLMRGLAAQIHESGFLFSTELVYLAERMGLQPMEVPVRISGDHGEHRSRVTPSDIASMAIGLIRIRMRHRAGWGVSPVSPESPPRP